MKDRFSIGEVIKALNIPRERFKEWVLRGYVKASIQEPQGSRKLSFYSISDILIIAIFKKLIESGISRNVAKLSSWTLYSNKSHLSAGTKFFAFFTYPIGIKGNGPIYRAISEEDSQKPFNTLFVDFSDVDGMDKSNVVKFNLLTIIDFESIRGEVYERLSLIG